MNKDEFEDKAKERVLLVEEANSTLKKLFSEATTLGLNVRYVRSKADEVIRSVEAELNKQEAPKEVKDQIILSLKKSVVDWYNYTTYYLERRAKVAKNPIERNLYMNTVAALSGQGGAKTITIGNNEVSNLREYVMSSEKGYGNLIIPDYDKKIKNDINQLMTDISEKRLTLFDSLGRRKSIRNLAEISARTEAMRSHLLEQKEKGVKYVLSSQHADCSERCRWWQNKVFIIDCDIKNYLMQTYDPHNPPTPKPIGKVDGIDYYSLDEAINYGFLGYNCRHNLIPYQKGMYIPKNIPQNRVEKERNLEIVQRRLECKVRDAKLHEITAVPKEERQKAIADSKAYQAKYDEFCKKNGLVKYEWRCRITKEERDGLPIIEENTLNNPNNDGKIELKVEKCNNFDELESCFKEEFNVKFDSSVKELHFETTKKALQGLEIASNEFPVLKGTMKIISTRDNVSGVMLTSLDGSISFNKDLFDKSNPIAETIVNEQIKSGQYAKNTGLVETGAHEVGHLIEAYLLNKKYPNEAQAQDKAKDWYYSVEATKIVKTAHKNLEIRENKKVDFATSIAEISRYALSNMSETIGEAIADYMANGDDASRLSKEIWNILKEELK